MASALRIGPEGAPDERVDQCTVAERHAQVAAAAPRGQVLAELGIVVVARQLVRDLGLDLLVAGVDPLLLGDRRQDEQRLDPARRRLAQLGQQLLGRLLGERQVLVHPDPLLGEPRAQLVAHDLDLVGDHHLGQLDRRVGGGEVDDPVAERVARLGLGALLHRVADLGPQLVEGLDVADALRELVGDLGQQLLAQVEQLDLEVGLLALQLLDTVVIGEGDVEALRLADAIPTRLSSQPGIMRSSPMTSGIRSADPPSNGSPSIVPTNFTLAMSSACAARSSTGRSVACCSRSSPMTCSTCSSVTSGSRARTG